MKMKDICFLSQDTGHLVIVNTMKHQHPLQLEFLECSRPTGIKWWYCKTLHQLREICFLLWDTKYLVKCGTVQ